MEGAVRVKRWRGEIRDIFAVFMDRHAYETHEMREKEERK